MKRSSRGGDCFRLPSSASFEPPKERKKPLPLLPAPFWAQSDQTDCLCLSDKRHVDINIQAPTCCRCETLGLVVPSSQGEEDKVGCLRLRFPETCARTATPMANSKRESDDQGEKKTTIPIVLSRSAKIWLLVTSFCGGRSE